MKIYEKLITRFNSITRIKLIAALLLVAVSAFAGGIGLAFFNGLNMPVENLGGIFSSYFWPGMILFFVVGGTNLLGAIMVIKNNKFSPEWSAIAGFGLLIWIYTEIYIIKEVAWLQVLYFALGIVILILSGAKLRAEGRVKQ